MALLSGKQRIGAYEIRELQAYVKCISQTRREFVLVHVCTPRHALLTQLAQKFSTLRCEQKMLVTSAEFNGEQSHESWVSVLYQATGTFQGIGW